MWYQRDGGTGSIHANRYVAGTGWGTAQLIEAGSGNADKPQIAIDASGNAIAVWYQLDGGIGNIYANRYAPDTGWGSAQPVEGGSGAVDDPQIAIDGRGNAIAVWSQSNDSVANIYANRYASGTGWGSAQLIKPNSGYAMLPQVAIGANGNAIAVWTQFDEPADDLYANHFD